MTLSRMLRFCCTILSDFVLALPVLIQLGCHHDASNACVPASRLTAVSMSMQNNPEGYHADSKVNEGVLGPELWNAAQVRALSIHFHQPPLV